MRFIKEIGKAFFIGSVIFIIIGLIKYFNGNVITDGKRLLIEFIHNQMYAVFIYMGNSYFFTYLRKKYPGKLFTSKNLGIGFIGAIAVTILSIFFARIIIEMVIDGEGFVEFLEGESIQFYFVAFVISIVVTFIFYLVYYYRFTQERKVKEQKILAGTASAQFDALKNQLDPHFLFNSLNVLTSLIEENTEAATRFTIALSKVYRYVLEQKNKELVTIEEELKFARIYMSLIKMRFEDSIVFTTPEHISNPEAKVVPLSLQLLLENAVKHNQVTPSRKLHISIQEKDGNLIIKNNVQPKNVVKGSSGVGLQNIRKRYHLLTDRPVAIQQNEKEFVVSIPLLTQSIARVQDTQEMYISDKKYARAKKKVEELQGFYIHLVIYLLMIPVFIFMNMRSTGFPWAIFPIIGWGAGISSHAMEVFNYNPFLGKNWEERKIRELMDKEDK
ncbi:MAG: histidine kinase [Bacteroidetes bacterium]|nr:MAG: histidine kinase [Bacteroidota bacterium]